MVRLTHHHMRCRRDGLGCLWAVLQFCKYLCFRFLYLNLYLCLVSISVSPFPCFECCVLCAILLGTVSNHSPWPALSLLLPLPACLAPCLWGSPGLSGHFSPLASRKCSICLPDGGGGQPSQHSRRGHRCVAWWAFGSRWEEKEGTPPHGYHGYPAGTS